MSNEAAAEAFRNFDFESDERWKAYALNLEIPPGRDTASVLQRFKAKWYKREIDPSFDPSLVTPARPSPSNTNASASPPPTPLRPDSDEAVRAQAKPADMPTSPERPASRGQRQASGWLQRLGFGDPQRIMFVLHIALLVLGFAAVQPLNAFLAFRAWRWFLSLSVVLQGYKVYLKCGLPRLRPFPQALKEWAMPAAATTDFQYLLLSVLFLQTRPLVLVVFPLWVLALYHAVAYASQHFGHTALWRQYGATLQTFLAANQGQALVLNAGAEIGVGFLLILGLLSPQRTLILTFIYWRSFLPTRYHTPDAAAYHRQAWSTLAARAQPVLRAVPMLQTPISFVKRAFENPR